MLHRARLTIFPNRRYAPLPRRSRGGGSEAEKLLEASVVQNCQHHDDKHRSTCGNSAKAKATGDCRFHFPFDTVDLTHCDINPRVKTPLELPEEKHPGVQTPDELPGADGPYDITYEVARTAFCVWLARYNPSLARTFRCNSNVQFILTHAVAWYIAMYTAKQSASKNEASLADCVRSVNRKIDQLQEEAAECANRASETTPGCEGTDKVVASQKKGRTNFGRGMAILHAGWRGASYSEIVGAQRAAIFGLG